MANGDDRKAKLPEGYVLDQEWESGEGPTAAATTAAGQSTPPGARDTAGDLGKLGAISRTVGDTVRGAVTPSKPQGKTASEEAGEAIRRGWRALITPPPPRLPPQGPARETMSAQPTFWQGVENLAGQGPGQMESRAPAYENMTPEGRAEHPILSRVGDVTRRVSERSTSACGSCSRLADARRATDDAAGYWQRTRERNEPPAAAAYRAAVRQSGA